MPKSGFPRIPKIFSSTRPAEFRAVWSRQGPCILAHPGLRTASTERHPASLESGCWDELLEGILRPGMWGLLREQVQLDTWTPGVAGEAHVPNSAPSTSAGTK